MNNLVHAICYTLMHSLWQGALLSVVTGLIIICTRKSSSALRYNLLVSAMVLFAAGVAGTFFLEYDLEGLHVAVSAERHIVRSVLILRKTISTGAYLDRYDTIVVWAWLLIVCARCVQLVTGLREVHRLRRKDTSGIGSDWEERVRQLCGRLGIKRRVGIAQSGRAMTPMVIGHLKPLILVPLGMVTSLSPEEAEAVLLHELAHIRRSDYLVNLLQNIMEIIFFFNPAVWWLSALIKAERENCCDDIAVVRSGKVNYLKALVACGEYNMPPLSYVMTFKTNTRGLKNRVARIISNKNQSLSGREKSLLAVCLIAAGICAAAFTHGKQQDRDLTQRMISDLLKDGIIKTADNVSFKIGTDEFVVNYQKQPDAVYQKYRVKYVVTQYSGSDDWIWYNNFDSQKWALIVAHKKDRHPTKDATTGVFRGKEN